MSVVLDSNALVVLALDRQRATAVKARSLRTFKIPTGSHALKEEVRYLIARS